MDPLLIWSSEPQGQPSRLPGLQRASSNRDLHHRRQRAKVLGRGLGLRCQRGLRLVEGSVWQAVGAPCWAAGGGGSRFGLRAKGEEIRVRGRDPQAAQGNAAHVPELDVSLPDLAAEQRRGEVQEKHLAGGTIVADGLEWEHLGTTTGEASASTSRDPSHRAECKANQLTRSISTGTSRKKINPRNTLM